MKGRKGQVLGASSVKEEAVVVAPVDADSESSDSDSDTDGSLAQPQEQTLSASRIPGVQTNTALVKMIQQKRYIVSRKRQKENLAFLKVSNYYWIGGLVTHWSFHFSFFLFPTFLGRTNSMWCKATSF